ncbi:MAG: thioredoxin [Clostridia bacterium]|nr:thioredoxin [Clostridia bacterium]
MSHTKITMANFADEIENAGGLVLLDFYAVWCGPCKMLSPILDEVAEEYPDVKVCKSDVDEAPDLAAKFSVQSIPTVVLFKDGEMVDGFVGFRAKAEVLAMIEKHA